MNMSPVSQLCPLPQRNPLVLFPLKDNTIELSQQKNISGSCTYKRREGHTQSLFSRNIYVIREEREVQELTQKHIYKQLFIIGSERKWVNMKSRCSKGHVCAGWGKMKCPSCSFQNSRQVTQAKAWRWELMSLPEFILGQLFKMENIIQGPLEGNVGEECVCVSLYIYFLWCQRLCPVFHLFSFSVPTRQAGRLINVMEVSQQEVPQQVQTWVCFNSLPNICLLDDRQTQIAPLCQVTYHGRKTD